MAGLGEWAMVKARMWVVGDGRWDGWGGCMEGFGDFVAEMIGGGREWWGAAPGDGEEIWDRG